MTFLQSVIDALWPSLCVGCRAMDTALCGRCAATIEPAPGGEPHWAKAGGAYAGLLQQAIAAFKFKGRRDVADPLADLLARLSATATLPTPDCLVPVPMSRDRLRRRGYNQARVLADAVGARLKVPVCADALVRAPGASPQTGLGRADRLSNLAGVITRGPEEPVGRVVWLVDDVITTGATMEACAAVLAAPGRWICGAAAARTP